MLDSKVASIWLSQLYLLRGPSNSVQHRKHCDSPRCRPIWDFLLFTDIPEQLVTAVRKQIY